MCWAAANLDPAGFDDPLTVDFDRAAKRHIAFASGFHRCLGSHLARMELTVILGALHERIPDYTLDPAHDARLQQHRDPYRRPAAAGVHAALIRATNGRSTARYASASRLQRSWPASAIITSSTDRQRRLPLRRELVARRSRPCGLRG